MTALTDQFPLRRASVWGGFRSNDAIPLRYGPVRGLCVEYVTGNPDAAPRAKWVYSDGACAGVDAVFIAGQPRIGGWSAKNVADITGRAVMMIEFSPGAEPSEGSEVEASGRGRVNNGTPIRNPADIIADLYAFAGMSVPDMQVFGIECAALGIECAGEVAEAQTVQRVIRDICDSIGAVFSPRMRTTAAVVPGGVPELVGSDPYITAAVDYRHLSGARSDIDNSINALRIEYAQRSGKTSRVVELDAAESIALIGRREQTLIASWIADAGIMATIGARILSYSARPKYVVSFAGVRGDIRPGDWVRVDGSASPVPFATGVRQVIATAYDPESRTTSGAFELYADQVPAIVVVNNASLLENEIAPTTQQRIVGSNREVKLFGAGGLPLSNRRVVLDGRVTRFTDGAGVVTFPLADTPRGTHTLTISMGVTVSGTPAPASPPTPPPAARSFAPTDAVVVTDSNGDGSTEVTITMEIFFD